MNGRFLQLAIDFNYNTLIINWNLLQIIFLKFLNCICIIKTKFWSIIPREFAILIFQFYFIRDREKNNLVHAERGNFLLYRSPMRILNNPSGEKRNPVKKRRNYARWIHGRLGFVERRKRREEKETERFLFRRWLKTTANFITRRFAATGVSKLEPAATSLPRFCFDEALNFTRGGSFVILWEGKFPPFLPSFFPFFSFFFKLFSNVFYAVTIFFSSTLWRITNLGPVCLDKCCPEKQNFLFILPCMDSYYLPTKGVNVELFLVYSLVQI